MKALVIINPRAGKKKSQHLLYPITDMLTKAGYRITCYSTQGHEDATRVVKEIGNEYELIICCGGDGTFQETVSGVMALQDRPSVGYLPCGSTNDLAKTLHIPKKPEDNLNNIVSGKGKQLDIGHFNDQYFTYITCFGAFSAISYRTSQKVKNVIGHLAYIMGGFKELLHIRPIHLRWECDGEKGEGDYYFGGVSNTTSIGGVYKLPEEAVCLDDGMFEMVLIQSGKKWSLLRNLLFKKFNERSHNRLIILRGKRFTFDFDAPVAFTLDGEYGGDHTHVDICCEGGAVKLTSASANQAK
ncbi:MAG: diacylglycerol kinase family lipid kinase [Ruminococcaceae bacterium]|nr:diacylglycerol kinase family lipid kinase [Oscillospiraceae bacterium]